MSCTSAVAAAAAVADVPADGLPDQVPYNASDVPDSARAAAPPVLPSRRNCDDSPDAAAAVRPAGKPRSVRRVSRSPPPSPPLPNKLKADGSAPPPDQLVLFGGRHLRSPTDDLITGTALRLPSLAEDVPTGNDKGGAGTNDVDSSDRSSDSSDSDDSDSDESDSDDDDASPQFTSTMSLPSLASSTADTPARGTIRSSTRIPGGRGRARITLSVPNLPPTSRGAPELTPKLTTGPTNITFHAASLLSLDDQLRVGALTRRVPWLGSLFRGTRTTSTSSPSLLARTARSMWPLTSPTRSPPGILRPTSTISPVLQTCPTLHDVRRAHTDPRRHLPPAANSAAAAAVALAAARDAPLLLVQHPLTYIQTLYAVRAKDPAAYAAALIDPVASPGGPDLELVTRANAFGVGAVARFTPVVGPAMEVPEEKVMDSGVDLATSTDPEAEPVPVVVGPARLAACARRSSASMDLFMLISPPTPAPTTPAGTSKSAPDLHRPSSPFPPPRSTTSQPRVRFIPTVVSAVAVIRSENRGKRVRRPGAHAPPEVDLAALLQQPRAKRVWTVHSPMQSAESTAMVVPAGMGSSWMARVWRGVRRRSSSAQVAPAETGSVTG
ncbi:hypothetical protein GGF31_007914 [Allomyces arbusculus]|nr:hypothetical protein GGF31_007914 [Allomyces arbusculus]